MKKGILFTIIYSLFSAVLSAIVKHVSTTVTTEQITFWQFFIAWLTVLPMVYKAGGIQTLRSQAWTPVAVRAIAGVAAYFCFYHAIKRVPLVDAVLLNNTTPLFLPIVVYFWGRQKMNPKLWWGITIGFIGIVVMLRPGPNILQMGALLGLCSGILSAIVMVAIRRAGEHDAPHILLFFYTLTGAVLFLPWGIAGWQTFSGGTWISLIGIGACMFLIQWFIALTYKYATPVQVAPFSYVAIVFAALLSWIFWQDIPDMWTVVGSLLVVGGAIMTIAMTDQTATRE